MTRWLTYCKHTFAFGKIVSGTDHASRKREIKVVAMPLIKSALRRWEPNRRRGGMSQKVAAFRDISSTRPESALGESAIESVLHSGCRAALRTILKFESRQCASERSSAHSYAVAANALDDHQQANESRRHLCAEASRRRKCTCRTQREDLSGPSKDSIGFGH